jgi:hypothetical protein
MWFQTLCFKVSIALAACYAWAEFHEARGGQRLELGSALPP